MHYTPSCPRLCGSLGGRSRCTLSTTANRTFTWKAPDGRCSVSIERLVVIVGSVKPAVLRQALTWANENRDLLRARWKELNP